MPRPRDPDIDRWEWPDLLGFMSPLVREGKAPIVYHHFRHHRKSSGLLYAPHYKGIARKKHEQWVREILLRESGLVPVTEPVAIESDRPGSVLLAGAAFLEANKRTIPKSTTTKLRQGLTAHFPKDVPLDHDIIYSHLVASVNASDYANGTLRKHLSNLSRLFQYCVNRKWMDRNPVELIDMPKEDDRDVVVWKDKEIDAIRTWIRKNSKSSQAPWIELFLRWISRTAMRPSEILRMQWKHVDDRELSIPETKTGKPRAIPIETTSTIREKYPKRADWQNELRSMLKELRRLYDEDRSKVMSQDRGVPNWEDGYVWPWQEMKTVRAEVREARKKLNLEDARRIYDLRATAEDFWVWELDFGIKQICAYAGHSLPVYVKYYRRRYGVDDRLKLMER